MARSEPVRPYAPLRVWESHKAAPAPHLHKQPWTHSFKSDFCEVLRLPDMKGPQVVPSSCQLGSTCFPRQPTGRVILAHGAGSCIWGLPRATSHLPLNFHSHLPMWGRGLQPERRVPALWWQDQPSPSQLLPVPPPCNPSHGPAVVCSLMPVPPLPHSLRSLGCRVLLWHSLALRPSVPHPTPLNAGWERILALIGVGAPGRLSLCQVSVFPAVGSWGWGQLRGHEMMQVPCPAALRAPSPLYGLASVSTSSTHPSGGWGNPLCLPGKSFIPAQLRVNADGVRR